MKRSILCVAIVAGLAASPRNYAQVIVQRPDLQNLAGAPPPTVADSAQAQGPDCASPERRHRPIEVARLLNSAEAGSHGPAGRYMPLEALGVQMNLAADEYAVQLTADDSGYMFSIKDKACGTALFSDQAGVIYSAAPLR